MRSLIVLAPVILAPVILAMAATAPAAAQTVRPPDRPGVDLQRDLDARTVSQMQAAKEHDTALQNELTSLRASLQTRETLAEIGAATARPAMPTIRYSARTPVVELSQFAQIPDATLAASNARAVAASQNRR